MTTRPATLRSSPLVIAVNQRTHVQKDDRYWIAVGKVLVDTCAKITLCVLSLLECLACAVLCVPLMAVAPFARTPLDNMAKRTAAAAQNSFHSWLAIFQVAARAEEAASTEAIHTWNGKLTALKQALYAPYIHALSLTQAHQFKIKLAANTLFSVVFAYAFYQNAGAIKKGFQIGHLSLFGPFTRTRREFGAQLARDIQACDPRQLLKTWMAMTTHYYDIGVGTVIFIVCIWLAFTGGRKRRLTFDNRCSKYYYENFCGDRIYVDDAHVSRSDREGSASFCQGCLIRFCQGRLIRFCKNFSQP